MKIISLNLAGFKDWEQRQEGIAAYIESGAADIVCLQEVKFDTQYSPVSQARLINESLQKSYKHVVADITKYYRPSSGGQPFREGLAVLTNYDFVQSEAIILTQEPDDKHPRICQLIDLEHEGEPIKIANVHFSNNVHSIEQLRELLAILEKRGEKRIIIGDFNILDIDDAREYFSNTYHLSFDYKQYVSFASENITLDYALLPKEMEFKGVSATSGLSDHSALAITIKEGDKS